MSDNEERIKIKTDSMYGEIVPTQSLCKQINFGNRHDLEDVITTARFKTGIIGYRYKIGNAGYVELLDYMGSDTSIVESARQSYNMGTAALDGVKVKSFIENMTKNGHTSPFEQAVIKFKIKMPIFVARQFVRHRTASMNESSLRYTESSCEFWEPDEHTFKMRPTSEKAANNASDIEASVKANNEHDKEAYQNLIKNLDTPRELARTNLPIGTYTEFVWSIDLNNLRRMLKLRMDNHAQREIFEYAVAIYLLATEAFPHTMSAFADYMLYSANIPLNKMDDANYISSQKSYIESVKKAVEDEIVYLYPNNYGRRYGDSQ